MPLELLRFEMLLPAFVLVLARVAGLVLAVPMLSSRQIPRVVKVWLVVTLSLMAFPAVATHLPTSLTLGQAATGMVGEFIIGEILGLGVGLAFFAAQIAGKMVSHQSGLALGTVFNPVFNSQSTILDQFWFFTALMIFLGLRGHVAAATVLMGSFKTVPPLTAVFDFSLLDYGVDVMQTMFELAIRIAGPAIAALFLTSLVMGFLTKTMPQLNILSVGFSFKIATALAISAVSISLSQGALGDALFDGLDKAGLMFEQMSETVMHGG